MRGSIRRKKKSLHLIYSLYIITQTSKSLWPVMQVRTVLEPTYYTKWETDHKSQSSTHQGCCYFKKKKLLSDRKGSTENYFCCYRILQSHPWKTDHKPQLTIGGCKKGLPTHIANRTQRWGTILLNYTFKTLKNYLCRPIVETVPKTYRTPWRQWSPPYEQK